MDDLPFDGLFLTAQDSFQGFGYNFNSVWVASHT